MCVLIDINLIPTIFKKNAINHADYEPIYDLLYYKKGKMVYGGSKYKSELNKIKGYQGIFKELKNSGRVCHINDQEIDDMQKKLQIMIDDSDFDDPHLVAIIIISGCKVVCTNDKRAFPFLKDKRKIFFKTPSMRPRIYRKRKHKHLLDKYANCSKLCKKI